MRTRAELLFYIGMNYSKLPISISDQISLLKGRGLVIGDDAYAKEQLGIISYFRLADYFQPLEDNHSLHTFKSDATFEDAVTLYYFDKELRSLIFTAIQSIEIALRSKMINHCALRYGAHWFMDFEWFKDRSIFMSTLKKIIGDTERSKEEYIRILSGLYFSYSSSSLEDLGSYYIRFPFKNV